MSLTKWANTKIKKLNWVDVKLIKIAVIAFTLMVVKLWSPLLSLQWYWYGLIFVLAAIKPYAKIFGK